MGLRTKWWETPRLGGEEESCHFSLGRKVRNVAVFVAFELKPEFDLPWSCPPTQQSLGHDAMLGLPCVWVQGELGGGGAAGMQDSTPQTPVAHRLPSRPARSPLPPGFYALKYLHNSVFSLKYLCKKTFYRHHNENAISLVGNRSTVTQNNGITVWSDPIAD